MEPLEMLVRLAQLETQAETVYLVLRERMDLMALMAAQDLMDSPALTEQMDQLVPMEGQDYQGHKASEEMMVSLDYQETLEMLVQLDCRVMLLDHKDQTESLVLMVGQGAKDQKAMMG